METMGKPDGENKDLKGQSTTWYETEKQCPNNPDHKLSGSTRRIYCADCGVWWWRNNAKV